MKKGFFIVFFLALSLIVTGAAFGNPGGPPNGVVNQEMFLAGCYVSDTRAAEEIQVFENIEVVDRIIEQSSSPQNIISSEKITVVSVAAFMRLKTDNTGGMSVLARKTSEKIDKALRLLCRLRLRQVEPRSSPLIGIFV